MQSLHWLTEQLDTTSNTHNTVIHFKWFATVLKRFQQYYSSINIITSTQEFKLEKGSKVTNRGVVHNIKPK